METRKIQPKKRETLEKTKKAISSYEVVAAADLQGVRSTQIQEIRKTLRGKAQMTVTKNTLFKKAGQQLEAKKKNMNKFVDSLNGSLALILTNMNPFELILFLNKNKVKVPAKGGDVATGDIMIPAGNTGLPPGPIISEFGEVKIPTKIESGSIWVSKDTVVVRKGGVISAKLASVLTRLGMKPMEAGLSIISAYDKGTIFNRDTLTLDIEEFKRRISSTFMQAISLAIEAGYVTKESALPIFGKAWRQARALAVKAEYATPETIREIVKTAYTEMLALENATSEKK